MRGWLVMLLVSCMVLAACNKTRSYSLTMSNEPSRHCYRDCRASTRWKWERSDCIASCPDAHRKNCAPSKKMRADAKRVCVEVTTTDFVATIRNWAQAAVVLFAVGALALMMMW